MHLPLLHRHPSHIGAVHLPQATPPVTLVYDALRTYRAGNAVAPALSCRLRVYQPTDAQDGAFTVVVCSAICPGSITNVAEHLATDMWRQFSRPSPFYWIEQWWPAYPFPEFSSVAFRQARGRLAQPSWGTVRRAEVEAVVRSRLEVLPVPEGRRHFAWA